jgi:hypothetical protein
VFSPIPEPVKGSAALLIDSNPILRAQKILRGNVKSITNTLDELVRGSELEIIEILLALENRGENQNGAPRTTVTTAIQKALTKCGGVTAITESDEIEVILTQEETETEQVG